MFQNAFSHYLSYGASDQHTVRELRGNFDGILVPGTIAAFQKDGTGGFVLSLSATNTGTGYVIDPRFPLFQQHISEPKKSHLALRSLLGLSDEFLAGETRIDQAIIENIGRNWATFNCQYDGQAGGKFSKYAKRLGEELSIENASLPQMVLAPYLVSNSPESGEWDNSKRLFDATSNHVSELSPETPCIRVVATEHPSELTNLLNETEQEVAIWVSNLNELQIKDDQVYQRLIQYGVAIKNASESEHRLFALYGGFFSILLGCFGLAGSSHGIGFGENRNWLELPRSGPPPARFYLKDIHRYVLPDLAYGLWSSDISRCDCKACDGDPPVLLEYHDLMMHSVYCRANEIDEWSNLDPSLAADQLESQHDSFILKVISSSDSRLSDVVSEEIKRASAHIPGWVSAIRKIVST